MKKNYVFLLSCKPYARLVLFGKTPSHTIYGIAAHCIHIISSITTTLEEQTPYLSLALNVNTSGFLHLYKTVANIGY